VYPVRHRGHRRGGYAAERAADVQVAQAASRASDDGQVERPGRRHWLADVRAADAAWNATWQSGLVMVSQSLDTIGRVVATGVGGNQGPNHVPGVVITGVVIGILLMWAAIRAMFGKRK
jgi:hypothetical protein